MLFKGKPCPSCKTQETSLLVSSTPLTSPPPGQGPCTSDFFQRLIHFTMSYRCQVFPKQFWLKAFDAYWTRMWKRNAERGVGWEKERWWPRLWDSSTGTQGPPTKHTFTCCCSVAKSRLTLCDPMDCSMSGFLVLLDLPEFAQTHVHWVDDTIQPSHSLFPPSPALNLSQHQGLFQWVTLGGRSIGATASASVLPVNINSLFPLGLVGLISLLSKGLSRVFSSTTVQKHQFFSTQPSLEFNSHTYKNYKNNSYKTI